jgi:hypothetical protein
MGRVRRLRLITEMAEGKPGGSTAATRLQALKMLGELAGEHVRRVEHSGTVGLVLAAMSTSALEAELDGDDDDHEEERSG